MRGWEYQDFTWKIFCLTMPKFSVGRSLYCFINVGYRKSLDKRGGEGYQDFPSKIFCRVVPKISVEGYPSEFR